MKEESIFNNGFFEFLNIEEEYNVNGEIKLVKRQIVRRPPGIRALIFNKKENKILLSREYRYELKAWDYRLPGGKVFDNLSEYKAAIDKNNVLKYVEETVPKEVKEEVGIKVKSQSLIKVSKAGAGVIWDLYYFEITDYEVIENGQELGENEFVSGFEWKTFDEIIKMCIDGEINEERTVGVLLAYILKIRG